MAAEHVHNWALGALLDVLVDGRARSKSHFARESDMTPQEFGDWVAGRRAGTSRRKRQLLADALGVDVRAITCWCGDRVGNHVESESR